ncbi:hypothetical protein B9Z55_009757 [Caenorhabditis nigoni]|uniref:Uncharacterized protein n=1 Tax=Caenorhabditis nigoni TaxID=1611254 RepID=A0A2G5UTC9_9PELO|nr:hypothetical protein B9Z55_009757 [Caenorhabditis nigoni]
MSDSENNETDVRRSSRRCGVSAKTTKMMSEMEKLKQARATGKVYRPDVRIFFYMFGEVIFMALARS